jgi:predicted ATP-grasp superfamily ATP-dependent carboligase
MPTPPVPHVKPLKILMTEGTSLSARQSLYALGGRYVIDVIDPNPLCQCRFSRFVRHWQKSPHFAKQPTEFLHFLAARLREEQYDVVLPTHEQVYLLSKFRDVVGQVSGIALPSFHAMQLMQNKADFTRTLESLDLPYPETVFARTQGDLRGDWKYPFYLKLSHSTAGLGVFHITSEQELAKRIDILKSEGKLDGDTEILVQQPARGNQATVQAVFDHGQVIGIHMFDARQLGVGGMSAARTGADHPVVREHIAKLGTHLNWHGAMFVDYFYDYETARPEYIECNPRVGETVNAWLSGTNVCEQLVRLSAAEPVSILPLAEPGVRTQSFYMILLTLAYDGASRGELLREIVKFRLGRGMYADSQDELTRVRDDYLSGIPLWFIASQLLVSPRISHKIVASTVDNYSMPKSSLEAMDNLDVEAFREAFTR